MPRRPARWLLGAGVVPVLAFLIAPTLIVVPMALTPQPLLEFPPSGVSARQFEALANDGRWLDSAVVSIKVAVVACLIACFVATTAAIAMHGRRFRGRGLLTGLLLAPIVAPLIVLALGDFRALAEARALGGWLGIALAHSVLATPYVFVTVQASLSGLDPSLVRSARSLGAKAPSVFRHVYLPTILPGMAAGVLFAFAVSFDEVVISLFLQGPEAVTLPVRMYTSIEFELTPVIAAVATLLVALATVALLIQTVVILRRRATQGAQT